MFDATAVSFWSEKEVRKWGLKGALYEGKEIDEVKGRGMTTPCIVNDTSSLCRIVIVP